MTELSPKTEKFVVSMEEKLAASYQPTPFDEFIASMEAKLNRSFLSTKFLVKPTYSSSSFWSLLIASLETRMALPVASGDRFLGGYARSIR